MNFQSNIQFTSYLEEAFKQIGATDYDVLFLYFDLRAWSVYAPLFSSRNGFLQSIIQPFIDRKITIIIPTFTFTDHGEFHVDKTQTHLGAMNKWFVGFNRVVRSQHPLFSFAAIGPLASMLHQTGKSAFGAKSVYDLFQHTRAAFLHIGIPLQLGNTFIHYVEQICGASYRYNKVFKTDVFNLGEYIGTDYSVFVRRLNNIDDDYRASYAKVCNSLYEHKLIHEVGDSEKLLNISCYPLSQTLDLLIDLFYKDPCIFIKSNFKAYE
jgi:aminoglycoside N3'-acetyltransferase